VPDEVVEALGGRRHQREEGRDPGYGAVFNDGPCRDRTCELRIKVVARVSREFLHVPALEP
jgi:hypothetical protein